VSAPVLVGIIIGVLLIAAAVVLAVTKQRPPVVADGVDPLFIVGISVCGAGAALMATMGPAMMGMMVLGIVFISIGAGRMRRGHR